MTARLAIDIGGTFTDVVLELDAGKRATEKLLTTQGYPGEAVLLGIDTVMRATGTRPAEVSLIIHGTTLATNALIERRGATTALLTTAGHRDALEMAHEDRFEQYDINIDRPAPLVPRYLRLPIKERLDRDGNVLVPLDEDSVMATLPLLEEHGVDSVTVGFLHAFVNPAHEQRTAELLRAARPDLSITLASEVCPEIREFERLSTACANAYVRPLMARYLERLGSELAERGLDCPFLVMTSGGGLTTLETAAKFPIRLVESGPAGGAILAQHLASKLGMDRLLSFDMGGTTAKLCLIDDFAPLMSRSFEVDRVYRFKKGSGLPVRIPVIEMVEIGAGGGSIAKIDRLRRIQTGPESAGSEPGPAAYGRGGAMPTVTDADTVLGRIKADGFAGGTIKLQPQAASQAIDREIGGPLGFDQDSAAFGISEVVDENMAAAARAHAAEFGLDLTERDMVAFGGAGPLHAARLGEKLGVRRVVIPPHAGVGSAVGFLLATVAYEVVRSRQQTLSALDHALINRLMAEMRTEAETVVAQAHPGGKLTETRQAYMRYAGQGHEIVVDLPIADYDEDDARVFRGAFEAEYRRLYGRTIAEIDVEVLSWTLTVSAPARQLPGDPGDCKPRTAPSADSTQSCFDPVQETRADIPVYSRQSLAPGVTIVGPALITEDQTTTVVTSAFDARIDASGNIVLSRRGSA
jgi:N-methylhydantoinase A